MRRFYTFFLYLLIPFLIIRLYWKGRRLPQYRRRISERFQLGAIEPSEVDVWIHAVSLGEVVAVTPVIDAFLEKKYRVMVTTMTPTGSEQVSKRFGQRVAHQYLPYDLPWALRRFFKKINARIGIIMETELWPNVIFEANRRNLPLLLANARLSDDAFKSYQKVRFFFKPILQQFTEIMAQSEEDARRYVALGAPSQHMSVLGNLKFDLQITISKDKNFPQFKEKWGKERVVFIAASTHDNEEEQLLIRLTELKQAIPSLLLLIAPRHPERFQTVYKLSKKLGFNTALRSQFSTIDTHSDVIILDSLGELLGFYQLSDYAFVGGSLVPIGGHNLLEPIAMQVPVFSGPYVSNAKAISRDLCVAEAIQLVKDADELMQSICNMHAHQAIKERQVSNANAVLRANRGSVARLMKKIEAILSHSDKSI
ncbi:lipid IV(A) 3-deoxy-D-manno-octulosonic acid transferase [Legionella nagasakiensis]|uniref:lipid IV(A) 3-deoxy-D-manno-octulosonic acid transferase n=1 Tax=Legionella nagasakiensis TaxID=535290 RepID=UPI0010560600|nr:lipid IV(A) 3-deoxy-D-manno-octulosonic acid transferase [Legionella nagasakiensis]